MKKPPDIFEYRPNWLASVQINHLDPSMRCLAEKVTTFPVHKKSEIDCPTAAGSFP